MGMMICLMSLFVFYLKHRPVLRFEVRPVEKGEIP
jgi:hypothetical protein